MNTSPKIEAITASATWALRGRRGSWLAYDVVWCCGRWRRCLSFTWVCRLSWDCCDTFRSRWCGDGIFFPGRLVDSLRWWGEIIWRQREWCGYHAFSRPVLGNRSSINNKLNRWISQLGKLDTVDAGRSSRHAKVIASQSHIQVMRTFQETYIFCRSLNESDNNWNRKIVGFQ